MADRIQGYSGTLTLSDFLREENSSIVLLEIIELESKFLNTPLALLI